MSSLAQFEQSCHKSQRLSWFTISTLPQRLQTIVTSLAKPSPSGFSIVYGAEGYAVREKRDRFSLTEYAA